MVENISKTKVTFQDVETGKEIIVNVDLYQKKETTTVRMDWGEGGTKSHKGVYTGLAEMFAKSLEATLGATVVNNHDIN